MAPTTSTQRELAPDQCAVERCADVVTGKWTLLVVRDLIDGPRSYSELEASLAGISPRTLCARLKTLVEAGLMTRTRITGLPPRTMYELTVLGHELAPIIETMRNVGDAMARRPAATAAEADAEAVADPCCD